MRTFLVSSKPFMILLGCVVVAIAMEMRAKGDFVGFVGGYSPSSAFDVVVTNQSPTGGFSTGTAASPGTPAAQVFGGQVSWTTSLTPLGPQTVVAHVLTQLNPNRRYRLQGTTIRGGNYLRRWTTFELSEAQSLVARHTSNCLTSTQNPLLLSNQVAINTGANNTPSTGDIFDWDEVQPSPEGRIVIYSRLYSGQVPAGPADPSAYALAFLRVQEFGTNTGPVVILQHPRDAYVMRGSPASFSVSAQSFGTTIGYQWMKDGLPLPGAATATFSIPAVTGADAGVYWVVVSNLVSTAISSNATLFIMEPRPPQIVQQPEDQLAIAGLASTFSVRVAPGSPFHVQWQHEGTNIPGGVGLDYTLAAVDSNRAGFYRAFVSNDFGTTASSNATLTLTTYEETLNCTNLVWASDPQWPAWYPQAQISHDGRSALRSGRLTRGGEVSFLRTTLQGPGVLKFWMKVSVPDNSPTIAFKLNNRNFVTENESHDWEQQVIYLEAESYTAEWAVYSNQSPAPAEMMAWIDEVTFVAGSFKPEITMTLADNAVPVGGSAVFQVSAEGPPPLSYSWYHEGELISEASFASFGIRQVQPRHVGRYSVVVGNQNGTVTNSAVLTVQESRPIVLLEKAAVAGLPGGEIRLQPRVAGSEPMSFQWFHNAAVMNGETNATLRLRNLGSNQLGRYTVVLSNAFGVTEGNGTMVQMGEVQRVLHISADGLGATHLSRAFDYLVNHTTNFWRLFEEGASTLNARCDYANSLTVPNHLCMLTGRPVLQPEGQPNTTHHGYAANDSFGSPVLHRTGNTNIGYIASLFDVVHDRGGRTAFLAGKTSLQICADSYTGTNGAPDSIAPDHGQGKLDAVVFAGTDALLAQVLGRIRTNALPEYTVLHLAELDLAGHRSGWGSLEYFDELKRVDGWLGCILDAIDTNAAPEVRNGTVVILTADHGGGTPLTSHSDPTQLSNYTIPLVASGPGFPAGVDLHSLFVNRADPGTNRLDYNAIEQPLRNGDSGNMALACLGLPPIPGSSLIPLRAAAEPGALSMRAGTNGTALAWSRVAAGARLESTSTLSGTNRWEMLGGSVRTNINTFEVTVDPASEARFYRLRMD